jgi:uncharacterized glyoxalase superfamily protein PhnB
MADGITVRAELVYEDPDAALRWLEDAFGFETRIIVRNPDGRIVFSESGWGEQVVAIVPAAHDGTASPRAVGGLNTQVIQVRSPGDVEAHCARARAAGAEILAEPQQHFFGDKTYIARDLEGHIWTFGQPIAGANGPPPPGWSVTFPAREKARGG